MSGIKIIKTESPGFHDDLDNAFPSNLRIYVDQVLSLEASGTHFGFVLEGSASLDHGGKNFTVHSGMFFSIPGSCRFEGRGKGFIVTRENFKGLFSIGGPVERFGRLKYIDGCSDTLLIAPVLKGDPCMNFLFVPPGTDQTAHTHPSVRVGMVLSGSGKCRTPEEEFDLLPGQIFCLMPDQVHSFHTQSDHLRIIVYHPDSDFGPTHENHPMLNRSYVDGKSASEMPEIQTQYLEEN